MTRKIISVENLSKAYRLGVKQEASDSLVGAFTRWLKSPIQNWQRLRSLNTFGEVPVGGIEEKESDILWALRDVCFTVEEGEVVAIIGRNGAGKSTLLKILSRITEPTHGRAVVRGRVSSLLEVGTGFHPELTGRENIYMNGTILGMRKKEIDRCFDEIVDFSGVETFLDTPIKRYSSGMKVRLAFAVASHLEPEVLIIDEVLAVGDAEFQTKCLGKMDDVSKAGRTVLFVSHNMAAVSRLCSRGVVLRDGLVEVDDTVETAMSSYLDGTSSDSSRSLSESREKWCTPLVQSVRVNGNPTGVLARVPLGASLEIELTFETPEHSPIRFPMMGIVFNHMSKGAVGGVNTRMTGFDVQPGRYESGVIKCSLPKIPFLQGRYSVDIWFGDGTADMDVLRECGAVEIEDSDYYGTGRAPMPHVGSVFLDADWSLLDA